MCYAGEVAKALSDDSNRSALRCRLTIYMKLSTTIRRLKLWIVIIPLALILLGAASNQAVLIANHDKFPVMVNGISMGSGLSAGTVFPEDTIHCVMGPATHLNLLADIFDFHAGIYSLGDGLLLAGEWLWQYAPAIWIFTLCSTLLGGKNEPAKSASTGVGIYDYKRPVQQLGRSLGLPGANASPSFNRAALQQLQGEDPTLRLC